MPSLLSNGLRILDPADIPPRKQEAVRLARLAVPAPNPGDTIQKIIRLADLESYLDGTFPPTVGGAVAVYSQVEFLRTPEQLISGLRLDYPGGFQGETRAGALLFPLPADFQLKIPFAPALGGDAAPNLLYPFTGTGFTAYVGGRLVPELSPDSPTRLPLPVGTQLVEIDESGQRILRATLGPEGTWLLEKVTLRATRTGAWLSPRFSQRAA